MKRWLLALCCISLMTLAAEPASVKQWMAPPLPLSEAPPLEVDGAIQDKYLYNEKLLKEQSAESLAFIHTRGFPWLYLLSSGAVIAALLLVYLLPPRQKEIREDLELQHRKERELLLRMQSVYTEAITPKPTESFQNFERLLRSYLEQHYHLNIKDKATPELIQYLQKSQELPPEIAKKVARFLTQGNEIKFGKMLPSDDKASQALDLIDDLLH